jgi:hypothetical protein
MRVEQRWGIQAVSIGWLIAVLVLLGAFVLWTTGQLDGKLALLIGGLAVARLV